MRKLTLILSAAFLSGCMSTGTNVSDNQLTQFKPGVTTEQEVIARLGTPSMNNRSSNGEIMDMYNYSKFSQAPESFIPFFGMFVAHGDMKSKSVTFYYTQKGILKKWDVSSGDTPMNQY